jgi:cation diffusion facilitator CzcD-associated flavoprotein CzcO
MDAHLQTEAQTSSAQTLDYDAIIVGAGMSGLYQLYRLRELGMRVKALEAGTGVGGTWYRNHIADKFDLRRDIQLRSRVTAARAAGFDSITDSFDHIDIRGANRQKLKDKWTPGPRTYLGVQVEGFPNMMMLMGPHTALGNIPRGIEYNVDWVTRLIARMRAHDFTRAEATPEGVAGWTNHVKALGVGLLSNEVNSWMTGINSNVEDEQTRIIARYSGSARLPRALR